MRRVNSQRANVSGQRKTLQLCRQVERALMFVLSDSQDDVLRDLMVVAVEPAPNAGRLLVTTTPMCEMIDPLEATSRLQATRGRLRTEIAASINRRKVPDLLFQCVMPKDRQAQSQATSS